jgi:hypothetical protein
MFTITGSTTLMLAPSLSKANPGVVNALLKKALD